MPSVALESLAPAGDFLAVNWESQVAGLPRPVVPMSSISPSHNEPPMWAQRLSLDRTQLVVRINGIQCTVPSNTT